MSSPEPTPPYQYEYVPGGQADFAHTYLILGTFVVVGVAALMFWRRRLDIRRRALSTEDDLFENARTRSLVTLGAITFPVILLPNRWGLSNLELALVLIAAATAALVQFRYVLSLRRLREFQRLESIRLGLPTRSNVDSVWWKTLLALAGGGSLICILVPWAVYKLLFFLQYFGWPGVIYRVAATIAVSSSTFFFVSLATPYIFFSRLDFQRRYWRAFRLWQLSRYQKPREQNWLDSNDPYFFV